MWPPLVSLRPGTDQARPSGVFLLNLLNSHLSKPLPRTPESWPGLADAAKIKALGLRRAHFGGPIAPSEGRFVSRGVRRKRAKEVEAHTASAPALPPLDEATFQQLLEAAYVIQEQREAQPVPRPERPPVPTVLPEIPQNAEHPLDAAEVLALIVETQEQLRSQVRDLPSAGKLIAQRLEQVTGAAGVAIAVIREDHLEFCAATGVLSSLAGSIAPVGESLPDLLRANSWSSVELAIRNDAKCPIVFPIFHEGRTTGLLHLSFPNTEQLEEHQIRTCQLMAGLMGEAISRVSELQWKQTLAAERSTMMEILERLRPQLERLATDSRNASTNASPTANQLDSLPSFAINEPKLDLPSIPSSPASSPENPLADLRCQQCGFRMKEDEIFCGHCGAPQWDVTEPLPDPAFKISPQLSPELPAPAPKPKAAEPQKLAFSEPQEAADDVSLPPSLEAALAHLPNRDVVERFKPRPHPLIEDLRPPASDHANNLIPSDTALRDGSITLETPEPAHQVSAAPEPAAPELQPVAPAAAETLPEKPEIAAQPGTPVPAKSPWGSASQAQRWLKSLQAADSPSRIWINKHRADLWVVVSLILLSLALSGWGSRTALYGAAQTRVVQPSLTLFERFLVALNLAEPPPQQVYVGNPNVRVWVDLHTALYYCPGADLYGKTPVGKFTSQRDAQLDAFQPAARAYCQ